MKKIEGGVLWRLEKNFEKNKKMRFLNNVTVPKNVKGPLGFLFLTTPILLQNIQTNEETLWRNPSFFKKNLMVSKKIEVKNTKITREGILVCL